MHYVPDEPELQHLGGNTIGGNPQTTYCQLWAWLVKSLDVHSVLDVGCGEGHALREFQRLGCLTFGIDGAPRNVEIASRYGMVVTHDLCNGPYAPPIPVDLVWCCEVVGHVDAKHLGNVLATLCQGTWLAMTNETPGQQNHHHPVNLQRPAYWADKIIRRGYCIDAQRTGESMAYAHDFWTATGTIYRRAE